MTDDPLIHQTIQDATRQAWRDWACEHPSLANVIDRLAVTTRTAEKLRQSPEYHRALADYHRSRNEMNLFNRLVALAGPLIPTMLGL